MSSDEVLSNIYFDINSPGSFGGVRKLYTEAKKVLNSLTIKQVKNWIEDQLTYSLHKQVRNNFKRNKILVQQKSEQFEADLVNMQEISRYNKGNEYLITIIDCFSRFLYVYPIKKKTARNVIDSFNDLFKKVKPVKLRTDRGLEFNNQFFKRFLEKNNVIYFTSKDSKIKCAMVERVNRTLKGKMEKYFTSVGKRNYIDILDKLVNSYNSSYHRTIKMAPKDVTDDNRQEVFENIYKVKSFKELFDKNKKLKLKYKDAKYKQNVRVKYDLDDKMDKKYLPLWRDRIYKIEKIINRSLKPNYQLSLNGKKLERSYYPEEIQRLKLEDEQIIHRIEKIIRKRKLNNENQVLAKFIDHSDLEWIPQKRLKTVR